MRVGSFAFIDSLPAVAGSVLLPIVMCAVLALYAWHQHRAHRRLNHDLRTLKGALDSLTHSPESTSRLDEAMAGEAGALARQINALNDALTQRDAHIAAQLHALEKEVSARTRDYLNARDEGLAAVAMRAELMASLSHDLRGPISGLAVEAESLAMGALPPRARQQARALANTGRSLLATLTDILDVSLLRGSKPQVEPSAIDLPSLLSDLAALFYTQAREKGIELVVSIAAEAPRFVQADSIRLEQILSSLIANALRHTSKGHVKLRLEAASVPDFVSLTVSDTGEGMPKGKLRTLFREGAGVGLTVARQLTEAMGGQIAARSKPGEGTHIRLRLPSVAESPTCQPPQAQGRTFSVGLTGECERATLTEQLIQAGAIMAPPESADMVLLDADHRNMTGVDAARRVLLALSDDPEAHKWADDGRAACVLPRPVRYNDLNALIEQLRDGQSLSLPVEAAQSPQKDIIWPDARVLVVDDSEVSQQVWLQALAHMGIHARIASNGRQALQRLAQERYDLVLMDTVMPVMDGYQATRQLRLAEDGRRRTPVIALNPGADTLWQGAGMDGALPKPVTHKSLRALLAKALPEKLAARPQGRHMLNGLFDSDILLPLLDEVRSGNTVARQTLSGFRAETPHIVTRLRAALMVGERGTLMAALASLRARCDSVGAVAVSDLAAAMEAALNEGVVPPHDYGAGLSRIVTQTLEALMAEMASVAPSQPERLTPLPDKDQEMMRALEADMDANLLQMVYQPIFERTGTRIIAAEALIRWPRKNGTPIGPSVFIPLAERYGLIERIGEFARRRTFEETRDWSVPVAVNVSPLELEVPGFVARLRTLMHEVGYDPERLVLEMTETAFLNDPEYTRRLFEELRHMGIKLSLDDFGVGYSSLTALHRFAFDKIKIDREFISALGRDPRATQEALAIIAAITGLGRAFGMQVVAEGIETRTQHAHLKASGVNAMQGFLFGKPQTASSFEGLLRQDISRSA